MRPGIGEDPPKLRNRSMDLNPLPVTYRAFIPEAYLDEMGHMNVMWYTHLFSQAMGGIFATDWYTGSTPVNRGE